MSKIHAPRSAFSLVELLTVVAVLAILASMLLAVIGQVRDSARTTICASNLRQLGMAMVSYATDAERLPPPVECLIPTGSDTHVWGNSRASWDIRLADWTGGGTVPVSACPANRTAQVSTVVSSLSGTTWSGRRSYAMPIPFPHGIVTVNPQQKRLCVGWWDVEQHTSGSLSLAQVGDASGTALLVESWNEPAYGWNNDFGQSWGAGAFSNQDAPLYPAYGLSIRHRRKVNTAFTDGHVALQSQAEISGGAGIGTCPWDFAGSWTAVAGD